MNVDEDNGLLRSKAQWTKCLGLVSQSFGNIYFYFIFILVMVFHFYTALAYTNIHVIGYMFGQLMVTVNGSVYMYM